MIKVLIDGSDKMKLKYSIDSEQQLADELIMILDRVLIDEKIKISPDGYMKLKEAQKREMILESRNKTLDEMESTGLRALNKCSSFLSDKLDNIIREEDLIDDTGDEGTQRAQETNA